MKNMAQRNWPSGPLFKCIMGEGGVAEAGGVGRNDPEAREREMEEEGTRTQSGKN